ncbi:hypothetical protein Scep_006684 [Stephania cephalantha]|uniref:DNA repair protein RAD51 homolog 3 n=1 Tax=Stephania cephalantha TaxID=152367 RepID=A0AAP0K8L9_9MAGN
MEVSGLPVSASQRAKLASAGYTTLSSLSSISSQHLARDLNVSNEEALQILNVVMRTGRFSDLAGASIVAGAQSAWDMLLEEEHNKHITTSCGDLDKILGGGISCKEVTEIGGIPGIGKTQLGIQLAINVQIPVDYGGLGGKAIYIDTEGSFMAERVFQVAEGCIEDMLKLNVSQLKDVETLKEKMHPNTFLANIFYFRACSYTEQIAVINHLEKFVSEHKDVRIVVIDSVTFHFRQDFDDMALRTRLLSGMASKLMKLAKQFSLAVDMIGDAEILLQSGSVFFDTTKGVVILNQVTMKFTDGSFQLTLALGDSWSHACTNRVILYWNGNERHAYIDKSPSLRSQSAPYAVTSKGIRDVVSNCKRIRMM